MRFRSFILWLLTVGPAIACSCGSYEPVKACQIYHDTPVIFRGRVIDHNDDPTGGFAKMTLYRFRVLEAFKGLPPRTGEVFINPGSGSSCYTQFKTDSDYLVYTGGKGVAPGAQSFIGGRFAAKPVPAAWKGLGTLPVYTVGGCNPTRIVKEGDEDLTYVRASSNGSARADSWIEGRAVQNLEWGDRLSDYMAAKDATISAVALSGERLQALVQRDGRFRIGPLRPGSYAIAAQSPVLGTARLRQTQVEVPLGGCAVPQISFDTGSTITGRVLDFAGRPAARIFMSLGEPQSDGKVRQLWSTWANSDPEGNFTIRHVPVGDVVLAANLNGAPDVGMPFDPVYVPGTQRISEAQTFIARPGEETKAGILRLPKPLPFGNLYVDVTWPDGSPALGGARAFADGNHARAASEHSPSSSNRVRLPLALNRKYEIRVDWLDAKPGNFQSVEGDATTSVDFTHDGQVVMLKLKSPHP